MRSYTKNRLFFTLLIAFGLLTSLGCAGAMSQLLYVIKGHTIPAPYGGLEEKKIAVVCISDASAYGPDTLTYTISNALSIKLAQGLKEESVVIPVSVIEQWIDTYGWDERDFLALGKGVGADSVVAVDVKSYTIHEGSTMFKGKSDVTATVYNMAKGGQVDFNYGPRIFEYPKHGRPAIQTTEREFETMYLGQLVVDLANQFTPHDHLDTFANDAILNY